MKEQIFSNQNISTRNELLKDSHDLMREKKENLETVKEQTGEKFEFDEKTKEVVVDAIDIRKDIRKGIASSEYLEEIDKDTKEKIGNLAMKINGVDLGAQEHIFTKDENGNQGIQFEDGTIKLLESSDAELIKSLNKYFDSFREVHNAARFRNNIKGAREEISQEVAKRKLNFYSKEDKSDELVERVYKKYEQAGFSEDEIRNLLEFAELKNIDDLEIHDIKMMSKIKDIFSKFHKGDFGKYVGLSTALMVPAFLEGYAPSVLADAFKGNKIELEQVIMYALLTAAATGGTAIINKSFKDFSNDNYSKEDGFADYASKNMAEFPGDEIKEFGAPKIKQTVNNAKHGYADIMDTISFDVLPASVTLGTSAVMLYEKSPLLAGGTVAGGGLIFFIDKFVKRKGKFWQKERKADNDSVEAAKKIEQLLDAHMEVILAGEKDEFAKEMQELLSKEKASTNQVRFLELLQDKIRDFSSVSNMVIAGITSYFAGGSPDKFIAALSYSGRINNELKTLVQAKTKILSSVRDMVQMEVMFNGYAQEEKEKEQDRIGMSDVKDVSICLRNVNISHGDRKILNDVNLDIPQGSFVSLEGATGGGKTTLMKIISGYYKPDEGSVALGNIDVDLIKKSGNDSLYSKITYLAQFPYILDDTIRNNLTFGVTGEITDEEIRGLLKEVGLNKRFSDLSERVAGGRGDLGSSSGGETSRIGLARAILKLRKNKSRIVFLDEPTASVDDETAEEIAKIINQEKQMNPEATFISISHDKNFREKLNVDSKIILKDGAIG